jgi:hypothetical protein
MLRSAHVPPLLRYKPFRGSSVVAAGLLTKRQLTGPSWKRLFRDVYISAAVPVDQITMCLAAALLLPAGGALSHESATIFYNVPALRFGPSPVQVSVPSSCRLGRSRGLVVHRVRLDAGDVERRCGVPVTSPFRTAFDLGSEADPVSALVALDALLYHRVVRERDLARIALDRAGSRGSRRFAAAVRLRIGIEYDGDHHRERDTFRRDAVRAAISSAID